MLLWEMTPMTRTRGGRDQQTWRVEFDEWQELPPSRKRLLLQAVGDCGGEWWGNGKAEFWSREAALEAVGVAAGLGLLGRFMERV